MLNIMVRFFFFLVHIAVLVDLIDVYDLWASDNSVLLDAKTHHNITSGLLLMGN